MTIFQYIFQVLLTVLVQIKIYSAKYEIYLFPFFIVDSKFKTFHIFSIFLQIQIILEGVKEFLSNRNQCH